MIDVTLRFNTAAEAADALARLAGLIAPSDRPDAGQAPPKPLLAGAVDEAQRPAEPTAAVVFGGAAVPVVPPTPAPSTAVVAPPPTAPAATTPGLPPPPPVSSTPAVPPAPPAAAPTAPAAPTSPAGVELDSAGLPWDGRIHGSTRAKNGDGTWRQKRGLNDLVLKGRVEAELRAALAAGTLAGMPAPATGAAVPPPPVTPPAAPPVAPPAAAPTETFATLIARITPHLNPNRLTDAHVARVMQRVGLQGIAQLATRPDLVPAAAAFFDGEIAGLPA